MDTAQTTEPLASLQQRLQEMERGLRQLRQGTPAPAPAAARPLPESACGGQAASGERKEHLELLTAYISRHAGFKLDDTLFRKTAKLFASHDDTTLAQQVNELLRLSVDHPKVRGLIESLTVHETYFNRDGNQFALLRHHLFPPLIRREKERSAPTLRIWSAATSTGEEAYTLLMIALLALLDAGEARENRDREIDPNPRWRLELLGTDISTRILDRARQGIYHEAGSMGSFREMPKEFLPFFEFNVPTPPWGESGLRYARIKPRYAGFPRFEFHNLAGGVPLERGFDIILCRNVMIYFDDNVRRKVLEMHWQALNPEGVMLLGPPDPMPLEQRFKTCWQDGSVYYRKK